MKVMGNFNDSHFSRVDESWIELDSKDLKEKS